MCSTEQRKVLFVPCYFSGADEEAVGKHLSDARGILDQMGTEYIVTSALQDLDTAAAIERQAQTHEFDLVLLYLIGWVDTNVAVDLLSRLKDKPIAIWSGDYFITKGRKTHLGALAGFLPIKGALEQMGIAFAYVYGNADKVEVPKELSDIVAAGGAAARIARSRVGMVGYTAFGMYPGMVNPLRVKQLLGTEIVHIDNHTLVNLCENVLKNRNLSQDLKSFEQAVVFSTSVSERDRMMCMAMTEAIRQVIAEYKLSAITLRCCFELASDYGFAPCVPLSILSDECVTSCESDIPVTLSQLILHCIGGRPSPYVDIIMLEDFRVYAACCGFGAFSYAANDERSVDYSDSCEGKGEMAFRRVINSSQYEEGHYTLARLCIPIDGKPYVEALVGENRNDRDAFYESGCREFPSLGLAVTKDTHGLLKTLGSQHFAVIRGNVVNRLRYFCAFLGIEMEISN